MQASRRFLLAAIGSTFCMGAFAQAWPSKAIRVVVPFPPGGGTDIIARETTQKVAAATGWTFVIDNKPGAGGNLGVDAVAKAPADGYTIVLGQTSNIAINPSLYTKLPYDPQKDLAPITLAVTTPNILITKPALPVSSVKELVEYAKKNPGKLSYCSSGTGSSDHLTGEVFKQTADITAVHVPYKGGAACQTDIMGNQVDFSFQNLGAVTNYIKAGKMKALAVTAPARHPQLPEVPNAKEAGFGDLIVTSWQAVAAPAKTPPAVIARLNDAMVKTMKSPEVRERMNQIGFDVVAGTPEEFGKFMKAEVDRWTTVVQKGGIKAE